MTGIDLASRPSVGKDMVITSAGPRNVASIVGWGVDADPKNDPTYPYRDRGADDHNALWSRPPQQQSNVEILQSIEHVRPPAVFGTSSPPRYLSGTIRRLAFRWSESNWTHWLLLIGADRVNMIEGLAADLARGKIPNIPAEMGVRAEWKHNKLGLVKKGAVLSLALAGAFAMVKMRRNKDDERALGN